MILEKVLGDIASWCWLYLAAKPPHVEVDADELACPLHHPMTCSYHTRGHGFLSGATSSHQVAMGGGTFLGDAKPPSLVIRWSVDCLGTCVTEFYMECIVFNRKCLPCVRVIVVFYACLPTQTTIAHCDGIDPITRVYATRCTWAPTATSYLTRKYVLHLSKP
jgi:hypothetical protein